MQISFDPTSEADRTLVQQIVKTLPLADDATKVTTKATTKAAAKTSTKATTKANARVPTIDEVGNALGKFVEKHGREPLATVLQTFGVDSPKKLDKAFWAPLLVSLAAYEPEDGAATDDADPLAQWG